jgi:hypothetical protein
LKKSLCRKSTFKPSEEGAAMPAIAEKYDIDFEETVITKPRTVRRVTTPRAFSPARWNQMESLVEHFGDAAVADPISRPRRKSRLVTPKAEPVEAPHPTTKSTPRRAERHQPFRLTLAALVMWSTIGVLTLLLLGINGTTLALSQHDASVTKNIKLSQEAIDDANKSIASIQVSPATAQWAVAHGWHVADQTDFDEVPTATSQTTPEAGGAQ